MHPNYQRSGASMGLVLLEEDYEWRGNGVHEARKVYDYGQKFRHVCCDFIGLAVVVDLLFETIRFHSGMLNSWK